MLSAGRTDPSRPSGKLGDEPGSEGDLKAGVRGHMAEAATKGTIEADADADAARCAAEAWVTDLPGFRRRDDVEALALSLNQVTGPIGCDTMSMKLLELLMSVRE